MKRLLAIVLLFGPGVARSQDEQPAAQVPITPVQDSPIGTDIVPERESPIGLYITPWKDAGAEGAGERSGRLLQEELLPVDEDVFIRTLEYYEALTGALKAKNAVTPPIPSSNPATPSAGPPAGTPTISP